MNSLKNNSSIHHHESASRRKFTPIQQKKGGHEHGVRQLNGHINGTRTDMKTNKKNDKISDGKDTTSILTKRRRFGRENCDDIHFVENKNNKLPKQEIKEEIKNVVETPPTNSKKDQNNFPKVFSSLPTSSKHLDKNSSSSTSRYFTALRKNSKQQNKSVYFADQNKMEPWVKRKFYIVENAGIPTEIYCTDFIRKIKHQGENSHHHKLDDLHHNNNSNTLLRITDKWREEWSTNGVQMPLGYRQEKYQFENTNILLDDVEDEVGTDKKSGDKNPFTLPKRMIATYPSKYVKEFSKDYQLIPRPNNEQVQLDYKPLRLMRLDYEKSRNLCYMITRREKLKKTALELFHEQFNMAASNIFCKNSVVPISKRQMDKLLDEMKNSVEFAPSTSTSQE
ncbi:unnamed protein product [Meloidogyne enterolobii]|uniref:Uncharacterized protein n=1 Tax=Meloidogyne enterolobii TaxID=390850 RepID=A0ACB1B9E4_MELEN